MFLQCQQVACEESLHHLLEVRQEAALQVQCMVAPLM